MYGNAMKAMDREDMKKSNNNNIKTIVRLVHWRLIIYYYWNVFYERQHDFFLLSNF